MAIPASSEIMPVSLPGVCAVGYVPSSAVMPAASIRAICGVPVYVPSGITWVPIAGQQPSVKATREWKNNVVIETTTLEFITSAELPASDLLSFVVVDANERYWLIGRRENPRTRLELSAVFDEASAEPTAYAYTVTSVSRRSLILLTS